MPKSQKKPTVSVKATKPNKAQPKAVKKIAPAPEKSPRDSKQSRILALLQRPAGTTVDEMAKVAGWQRHSVQGMMSGVLKKRLGLTITSEKEERGRIYRIADNASLL